jgi:SAM-dependent methyltransferase
MKVFDAYARYYDLLYRQKDYAAEAAYVDSLLRRYEVPGRRLLELGCGTGRHATELASLGYTIHGIDRSDVMLEEAEMRARDNAALASRLTFSSGDVCSVRLDQKFDAAISLFHVMSYQTSDEAVAGMCETARRHLVDGGLFLFDCWYGPGVLTDPPTVRVARMTDEAIQVTRVAEPTVDTTASTVDVRYGMFVRDSTTGQVSEIKESHLMRYLFVPELRGFLTRAGFEPVTFGEWMTDRAPSAGTWNLCVVSRCPAADRSA